MLTTVAPFSRWKCSVTAYLPALYLKWCGLRLHGRVPSALAVAYQGLWLLKQCQMPIAVCPD